MAAIFPPADKGGIPPGVNVVNGYVPSNDVIGEGPLYVSSDCTTVLTSDQMNALTSEILAAVDKLGFAFNSAQIDNLGQALVALFDTKVSVSGDTMTGPLNVVHPPTDPVNAVSKQYVDDQLATAAAGNEGRYVNITGDTMTGLLALSGNPTLPVHAVSLSYANTNYINTSGDTMTGPLVLVGDPTQPLHPVTKTYGDSTYVNVTGDTMSGPLVLVGDPAQPSQAANKKYVDDKVAGAISTVSVAASAPVTAPDGALWFNTNTGLLYVKYNDGNTTQWVVTPPLNISGATVLLNLENRVRKVEGKPPLSMKEFIHASRS